MTLAPDDRAVVRRDPAVPGLATLLDGERLAGLLAAHLPHLGLQGARVGYLRYKPGTNCLAACELETAEGPVTAYAKAFRVGDARKLAKAGGKQVPSPVGPGCLVLPELSLAVHFHPNDRRLGGLRRLGQAETRRRLLGRLLPARPELWDAELATLAYKPERRYVATLASKCGHRAVARVYTRSGLAARGEVTDPPPAGLRLPQTVAISERHAIAIVDWLSGEPLTGLLTAGDAAMGETVGAALAGLHALPARGPGRGSPRQLASALAAIAETVESLDPRSGTAASQLAAALGDELALAGSRMCRLHGDFYAKQVLVADGGVAFVDLDGSGCGHPLLDLGNFLAHLERDVVLGRLPRGRLETWRASLLAGYRKGGGEADGDHLDLYTSACLMLLAPHPFRNRETGWRPAIERLVGRARDLARTRPRRPAVRRRCGVGESASLLDRALALLEDPTGPGLRRSDVLRSEVRRAEVGRGGGLVLGVEATGGKRWFYCNGEELRELVPAGDRRVPLAAQVRYGRLLAYRPGRRIVLANRGPGRLWVEKGYRRGRGAAAAVRHGIASAAGGRGSFRIARMLGSVSSADSLLFEHLAGDRVAVARCSAGVFTAVGVALRRFQGAPSTAGLGAFGLAEELAVLDRWAGAVGWACGAPPDGWAVVRRQLGEIASALPEPVWGLAHRDLHDGQLLLVDGGLALLDFDLLTRADVALDAANLLAHFELRGLQGAGQAAAVACERALRAGLGRDREPGFGRRLAFYRVSTALRLALVYRLRPRSSHLVPALVSRAAARLGELAIRCDIR